MVLSQSRWETSSFFEVSDFIKQEKDLERRDLVELIGSEMDGGVSLDAVLYATKSKTRLGLCSSLYSLK